MGVPRSRETKQIATDRLSLSSDKAALEVGGNKKRLGRPGVDARSAAFNASINLHEVLHGELLQRDQIGASSRGS